MREDRAAPPARACICASLVPVVIGVVGCGGPAEPPGGTATAAAVETAEIGGYEFHLEGDRLRYVGPGGANSAFVIDASSPCRLSRDPEGRVRTHETSAGLVFLVVCSRVERHVGGRPLCDTLVRGVVVAENGVRLPDREQRVGACPPFAWDEQMFVYFVEA